MRLKGGLVFFGLALAGFLTLGATAGSAAVRPPPGSPDLAQMALRISDLPPGARVKKQGYVDPDGAVAEYDREFVGKTARIGNKGLLGLESDVVLVGSVSEASLGFSEIRRQLSSKAGRQAFVRAASEAFATGSGDLKLDYLRVGAPTRLGVGEDSLQLKVTFGVLGIRFEAPFTFVRVDRIVSFLFFVGGPDERFTKADVVKLAGPVVAHVRAGLRPVALVPPKVSGALFVGGTLTATTGSWTNAPPTFAFQWQRCDAGGTTCADIAGAREQTYGLTAADGGSTVRVSVSARNRYGSAVAVPVAALRRGGCRLRGDRRLDRIHLCRRVCGHRLDDPGGGDGDECVRVGHRSLGSDGRGCVVARGLPTPSAAPRSA